MQSRRRTERLNVSLAVPFYFFSITLTLVHSLICIIWVQSSAVEQLTTTISNVKFSTLDRDVDDNEIRSEIHLDACVDKKAGHTLTKSIAACPGAWHGHVEMAGHLCSRHYKVCSWKEENLLKEISWSLASSISGCFAFNAAQDGNKCSQCKNDVVSDDLAAIGKHCPHVNFGQKACLNDGRIDASCCVDSLTRKACSYVPGVVTGVLCCYDPDSEKEMLYSDGGKVSVRMDHVVGERITLHCPIAPGGEIDLGTIAWFKDGNEIFTAAGQITLTLPFLQTSDSGIYFCRSVDKSQGDPARYEQLIQINVTVTEVKSNACLDGTSEGFHDAYNVRGCAGSWRGHIRRADKQLCGSGWRVCIPRDRHLLKQANKTYLTNYGGCFAYNAANIKSKCRRCQNKHSMAALGRDCPFNEPIVSLTKSSPTKFGSGKHLHRRHQGHDMKIPPAENIRSSFGHQKHQHNHQTCFENRVIQIYSNKFLKLGGSGCLYHKNHRITGVLCCRKGAPADGSNGKIFQMDPPVDDESPQKEEVLTCYPGCRNGGTCVHGTCRCQRGYFGHACQHGGCTPECQNGGICLYGFCKCKLPYFGPVCQHTVTGNKDNNSTDDSFDNELSDTVK